MKKILFSVLFSFICVGTLSANLCYTDDLLYLIPPGMGDIWDIDIGQVVTTHVEMTSYTDGNVQVANYRDGKVTTLASSTSSSGLRSIGKQIIFRDGQKLSTSQEWYLDATRTGVIVHVHRNYFVYTGWNFQEIIPR